MSFWWCLDHKRVEEGLGCGSTTRIGPYETQERAATALDRTRQRAAEQEARDKADEEKS
jgi:hypothetical protein